MRSFPFSALVLSLSLSAAPAIAASDMSFRLTSVGDPARCGDKCAKAIVAEGEIGDSTVRDFVDFVRRNIPDRSVRAVVFLHSPGGKVHASMALGRAFRAVRAAVVVARPLGEGQGFAAGSCFSACVYALMGGVKRVTPQGSRIGVHRMYMYESGNDPAGGGGQRRRFDDGGMRDVLARYSASMGVSSDLIAYAERTPSEAILMLNPKDIARWRLAAPNF